MGTIEREYEELDWWINDCCTNKNYLDSKEILWFVPLQQCPFTLLTLKINKTFTISSTCTLKYQFTYLIKYPSIHLFILLSIYLIYPFPCPPIHACMYPPVCPSVCLSVCRSVHRSSYPSVLYPSICLSIPLSIHPSIFI